VLFSSQIFHFINCEVIVAKELKLNSFNSFKVFFEEKWCSSIPAKQSLREHDVGDFSEYRLR
jgi:hypothetical protein